MIHQFWRLSEAGPDNLGLACTDGGLLLGRTPLIERREGRFVVRERAEIEKLLKRAFPVSAAIERLMPGLETVASALNANDPCLARIAAVHLKINREARQDILNSIAPYASSDPAEIAQARNLAVGGILLFSGLPAAGAAIEAPSQAWKLGWAARGAYINE
jgi:hypothetical protein